MLKIRLTRVGKKNSPAYRVVVAEQKKAVKRKFIEIIGHYNPAATPKEIVIKKDRALFWLGQGAQASDTVNNLMCDLEILPKSKKIKKVFAKKVVEDKKEEVKSEEKTAETAGTDTEENVSPAEQNPADEPTDTEEPKSEEVVDTAVESEE